MKPIAHPELRYTMEDYRKKHDAFCAHRKHAENRNIDFQFDFKSWVEWWGDDFYKRGVKSEDLVMARYNDKGPYSPDNVRKTTQRENCQERQQNYDYRSPQRLAKIAKANMKPVRTPEGTFESFMSAVEASGVSKYILRNRINDPQNTEYYYL